MFAWVVNDLQLPYDLIHSVESHTSNSIRFAFSPEVTCNCKMTWVRGWSKSERCYFSVTQNVFGVGLVVPKGWIGMCQTISTAMKDSYMVPTVFSLSRSNAVKYGYPNVSTLWVHNLVSSCWKQLLTASSDSCIICYPCEDTSMNACALRICSIFST